jgi:hypothetical protein
VPPFDIRSTTIAQVKDLFERFHVYKSTGRAQAYAFAVFEQEQPIAAFVWQPPPPGAARSVCRELPAGVLALSRMVAVPKSERRLKHISKPLKYQMKRLIDRTRWPVLVTYSDESVGHTGYTYKCSGWSPTARNLASTYTLNGARVSRYSNGITSVPEGAVAGEAWIQRWEHWAVPRDQVVSTFDEHWLRVPVPGKFYRSGKQAYTYERRAA